MSYADAFKKLIHDTPLSKFDKEGKEIIGKSRYVFSNRSQAKNKSQEKSERRHSKKEALRRKMK